MFSKSCEYGLRAVIYITKQSILGNKMGAKEIAAAIDSPMAFTGKILQKLVKSKIVNSTKGPYGGFTCEIDKIKKTPISEVVKTIDGDAIYTGCGLGLSECDEKNPCPLHYKFVEVRSKLREMLETNTIYSLIDSGIELEKALHLKR